MLSDKYLSIVAPTSEVNILSLNLVRNINQEDIKVIVAWMVGLELDLDLIL